MEILRVENLVKRYETFTLKGVSFTLDQGYVGKSLCQGRLVSRL